MVGESFGLLHQSTVLVSAGEDVAVGQQIGTAGNTGLSTAAHLHWEMWVAGNQIDPLQWAREFFRNYAQSIAGDCLIGIMTPVTTTTILAACDADADQQQKL
jgi:murein DD-endopeptidase MepM/ murein hydrolase activator NlpD